MKGEVFQMNISSEAAIFLKELMTKRNKSGVRIGYNEASK
jgi:hypothetical protein